MTPVAPRLTRALTGSPYQQYVYGYPHKTAYRALASAQPLEQVWAQESREALFLYVHIPFCEMRCGFCNLFTAANPVATVVDQYLLALEREAKAVKAALGSPGFVRAAVGGGTPTFLEPRELERVFALMQDLGVPLGQVPLSVEVSPETATPERLSVLRAAGTDRISIGIQSFHSNEVAAVKRPQEAVVVSRALAHIRQTGVQTLNLDLIYGIEGQTPASFESSLRQALEWRPEEVYLYPLYVRPLTALGAGGRSWDDTRLKLYRLGRDLLLSSGYAQVSMRMFRRLDAGTKPAPVYRCQEDGMVGLGCGARSYTRSLHYSQEWAVASRAVRGIIEAYSAREDFGVVRHGFVLDEREQRRRYALLSLLADGVSFVEWQKRFGTEVLQDLPELGHLEPAGLAKRVGERLVLTAAGVERSDALGPWLFSTEVEALMQEWELR